MNVDLTDVKPPASEIKCKKMLAHIRSKIKKKIGIFSHIILRIKLEINHLQFTK